MMHNLKERLLKNSALLLDQARMRCTDEDFLLDTIYLAVVKTKQRYKKLINKDRAIEVCISLMKQPRKHVKQSFASIEDCIEKTICNLGRIGAEGMQTTDKMILDIMVCK